LKTLLTMLLLLLLMLMNARAVQTLTPRALDGQPTYQIGECRC